MVRYLQQPAAHQQPASYGLGITVPAAERAALLMITAKAYHSREQLAPIVAGKTWSIANVDSLFSGQFEIPAQNAHQALQLRRALDPAA